MAEAPLTVDDEPIRHAGGARPWTIVALLATLSGVSFIDRMILALLVDPIRAEFGVSDTQIALLFGLGFVLFYGFAGIPIAWLADRGNRCRLLVMGVTLWSSMTLAAAFVENFTLFALTRAGVAIGEAVLSPIAISLIADLFPVKGRALPTSLYSTAGAVMASGSLVVGGSAVALAGWLAPDLHMAAWRLTLVIVSIPGFIGALLFVLMVREPVRSEDRAQAADSDAGQGAARHFIHNAGLYLAVSGAVGLMLMVKSGLVAWAPTMLIREFAYSAASSGAAIGAAAMTGAIVGTLSVPFMLRFFSKMAPADAIIRAAKIYAVLGLPALGLAFGSGSVPVILTGVFVGAAGLAANAVFPSLLVQIVTPPRMRARMAATFVLLINLLGLGLGPVAVSLLAEQGQSSSIASAIALMAWLSFIPAFACWTVAGIAVRRAQRRAVPTDAMDAEPVAV